jgi:hypothetical protein
MKKFQVRLFVCFITNAILKIRTNTKNRVRNGLDAKIRQSVGQEQPLFCIDYHLPDITIKDQCILHVVNSKEWQTSVMLNSPEENLISL